MILQLLESNNMNKIHQAVNCRVSSLKWKQELEFTNSAVQEPILYVWSPFIPLSFFRPL